MGDSVALEGEFVPLDESSEEEMDASVSPRGRESGESARERRGVKSVGLCMEGGSNEESAELSVTCTVQRTWCAGESEVMAECCTVGVGVASMCCTVVGFVVVRAESSDRVTRWRDGAAGEKR